MTTAYLGLGSNLGDRLANLRAAVRAIAEHAELRIDLAHDVASLYETSAVGGPPNQPPYLNSALRAQSSLSAVNLLYAALTIEASLGRTRRKRFEPRVIDIDLLLFGDQVIESPTLTLPHPRLHERRFVLEPLSDLAADLVHPVTGISIGSLGEERRRDRGTESVVRIAGPGWVLDSPAA